MLLIAENELEVLASASQMLSGGWASAGLFAGVILNAGVGQCCRALGWGETREERKPDEVWNVNKAKRVTVPYFRSVPADL